MKMDFSRIRLLFFGTLLGCIVPIVSLAGQPPLPSEWSFDRLKLKNGAVLKGLIVEETMTAVRFQHVHRLPGRPTVSMTSLFFRSEIDKLDRLSDAERTILKNRLKELDSTGDGERKRMETLELEAVEWNGKQLAGRRYDSDFFSLLSNAPEEIVRRTAVRLEQIYTAYSRFLPPRHPGGKPTTIVLYTSQDEYQKMLDERGWKLQNPAFFNPNTNRIICGSNLLKLGEDLDKARQQHAEQRTLLAKREADYRLLYGKKPQELARHLQEIVGYRREMAAADRHNDTIFDGETKRLFSILYHEAFHAYASNFVYCGKNNQSSLNGSVGELPRWLNEGIAQLFESSFVEAGELRVDQPDKVRLQRAKDAVRKGELMSLKDLLGVGPKQFLVSHNGQRTDADRAYLAAWATAAYLTFDRRLLGTKKLDEFVQAVNQTENLEEAFVKLTGQPLSTFEASFHDWLKKLPSDRSLLEPLEKSKKP